MEFAAPSPTTNVDVGTTTTWSVTGTLHLTVSWRVTPTGIVTLAPQGTYHDSCVVTGVKGGQATIVATLSNGDTVQAGILCGGILAYGPDGQLYGSYASQWVPVAPVSGIPSAKEMLDNSYGWAFLPPGSVPGANVTCYLISMPTMHDLAPPTTTGIVVSPSTSPIAYVADVVEDVAKKKSDT